MRDVNFEIRQSYYSLLNGALLLNYTEVPFFYAQLPTGTQPDNYVYINTITNTKGSDTDCMNMTNTVVQLMIVTKAYLNNDGSNADNIAGQIFRIILPNPQAQTVQITDGQVIGTDLSLDLIQSGLSDGQKKVLNRIISFKHTISHNN